jgi:hypothetical protein
MLAAKGATMLKNVANRAPDDPAPPQPQRGATGRYTCTDVPSPGVLSIQM